MKRKNTRLTSFSGKCPKVYNSGIISKASKVRLIKKAPEGGKPLKVKAPEHQEQKPLTIQFDISPDLFRKGKENTKKYHRATKAPEFTRCIVNGQVYFIFNK